MTLTADPTQSVGHSVPSNEPIPFAVDRSGTNIDEAVAFYEHVYSSQNIHIGKAPADGFSWRYRAVGDDDLVIGTSGVQANRWGTIGQQNVYILAWADGPGIVLDSASRGAFSMPPHVPVMYPAGRAFEFEAPPGTQHMLRFDAAFLEPIAAAQHGTIPGPLQFRNLPNQQHVGRLRRGIGEAAPELLRPGLDRARRSALSMLVAEAVVDAFEATPHLDVVLQDGPATMRFAQEWMVANAHRHLTSTDVARAAGVSARALQATFQRHSDTTPTTFLRQIRLHRVRAALVAGNPTSMSIAGVARQWGFSHLGRFAAYYADSFGERPSDTLRRSSR